MSTLTRYSNFKSLKKNSSKKVKATAATQKIAEAEVVAFFQLLSEKKANAKKA